MNDETDSTAIWTTYDEAIYVAKGLLAEQIADPIGEANAEYERGIVELIADLFGVDGVEMGDRKLQVIGDIHRPAEVRS